jgi:hypothetical protein
MPGPAGPQAGAVIRLSRDFNIGDIKPTILDEFEQKDFQGVSVYENREQPVVRLHQPNSRTIVVYSSAKH